MANICVLGSINMDVVLGVKNIPRPGETILANSLKKVPGGKGANQAVAASRLGGNVSMIGKVGKDEYGEYLVKRLRENNINTENIFLDHNNPTGMAVINVSEDGQNSIIVIPGSNMAIQNEEILSVKKLIENSDILIAQFETPIYATIEAFKIAKKNGATTILNPAPAREMPDEILKYTDIIIPNETETYELTKVIVKDLETAKLASKKFIEKGVKYVVVTMGDKGAALVSETCSDFIPAFKVNAVDTTAAGDAFIGALGCKIMESKKLDYDVVKDAVLFGNKVSSIVVQRSGAQPSIPYLNEVLEIYKDK